MTLSQNGWPVATSTTGLVRFDAGGRTWWAANDDVATIAAHVIDWFAANIEPLDVGPLDDWSWAKRPVTGQTSGFSNHASATAWDLNATKHPRGRRGTFTRAQVKAFDLFLSGLRTARGALAVRWGEHYVHAPTDGMHVEMNCSPAEARVLVEQIREATVTPADIEKIVSGVVAALTDQPIVPNQKVHPGDPVSKPFSVAGVLSNMELEQDQQGALLAEIHAAVVKPGT